MADLIHILHGHTKHQQVILYIEPRIIFRQLRLQVRIEIMRV